MTYPIIWPITAIGLLFGSWVALGVLILAVCSIVLYAGFRIARQSELSWIGTAALTLFILFNPWVYNKIVAGHPTQIMAYAGLALAAVELLEDAPSPTGMAFALILCALQTQFFIAAVMLSSLRIRSTAVRHAVSVGLIVFLPTIIGIVLDVRELLAWPFTVAWENSQSVSLQQGVLLKGYFPLYDMRAFGLAGTVGMVVFVSAAALGLAVSRLRRQWIIALCIALLLVIASGTTGWIGLVWRWAVVHAPFVGVYRELYDLIGMAAIGYALLAASALRRFFFVNILTLFAALMLVASWMLYPPTKFWVSATSLPSPGPALRMTSRYALMPPFQPLAYRGRGSGADPLYVGSSNANAPINSLLSVYPANAALSAYWLKGDPSALERLGVSVIECRRGFSSTEGAQVLYGRIRTPGHARICAQRDVTLQGATLARLERRTLVCTLCSDAGSGNQFFGDEDPSAFTAIPLQRVYVDPRQGWIDARLMFPAVPGLAQPLGGAYTESRDKPLTVPERPFILVHVVGELVNSAGLIIANDTRGYRWVTLPQDVGPLYCRGRCLVAGVGHRPDAPLNAPREPSVPLALAYKAPWLASVTVPANSSGTLSFLETYDPGWQAVTSDFHVLTHLRLDAALNGWTVPNATKPRHVTLVHVTTLCQLVAETIGILCCAVLLLRSFTMRRQTA